MQINSTELAGLAAFIPAALASAAAAGRGATWRRRGWTVLAVIYALLTVEIIASTRHQLDRLIVAWLKAHHLYPERRPAQAAAILLLLVLGLLAARYVLRLAPAGRLKIATAATAAVVTLFVVESVSLHALDAILYRPVGPIMLIGWLWLACGLTTVGAALSPKGR